MSVRDNEPPAAAPPRPGSPPEFLEMSADGQLEMPVEQIINKQISMENAVRGWAENMSVAMLMPESESKWQRIRLMRRQGNQLLLILLGLRPGMVKLAHSTDADRLLPALECILESAPMVKARAPAALQGLGVDDMPEESRNLQLYRELLHDEEHYVHGMEVLITNGEQSLDARARTYYRRLNSLMQENFEFGHDLKALRDLIKGSAEEGQDTKKRLAKARAEVKAPGAVVETPPRPATPPDAGEGTPGSGKPRP